MIREAREWKTEIAQGKEDAAARAAPDDQAGGSRRDILHVNVTDDPVGRWLRVSQTIQ
jgi:hypothetical protein